MSFFRRKPQPEPAAIFTTADLYERTQMQTTTIPAITNVEEARTFKQPMTFHCGCGSSMPADERGAHRCAPTPLTPKQQRRREQWWRTYRATTAAPNPGRCEKCDADMPAGGTHSCPGFPPDLGPQPHDAIVGQVPARGPRPGTQGHRAQRLSGFNSRTHSQHPREARRAGQKVNHNPMSKPIRDELALRGAEPSAATTSVDEEAEAQILVTETLPLLIERERARRDQSLRAAARQLPGTGIRRGSVTDDLPEVIWKQYQNHLHRAELQDERAMRFERILTERRKVASVTKVVEPRVYSKDSPHSWYLDCCRAALPSSRDHRGAVERLDRYTKELAVETNLGSAEGKRALRTASTHSRGEDRQRFLEETRALTSGTSSGGAFVTPQYLVDQWAEYRTYGPAFLNQTTSVHDVGYGMQLNIPSFTASVNVAQLTEVSTVPNTSPTGAYITSNIVSMGGEVDVSQILLDQSGPIGIDSVLHEQLTTELNTTLDVYAINQALSGAGSVTSASVFSGANFWGDIGEAAANVQTDVGVALPATHAFMPPTFFSWLIAQTDSNGRPFLLSQPYHTMAPVSSGVDGIVPIGWTGNTLLGSTTVFTDNNIPAAGSNARIIV